MNASELRNKSVEDLQQELNELLRTQFGLRFKHKVNELADTDMLRKVRRDIARVNTVLSEKRRQNAQ